MLTESQIIFLVKKIEELREELIPIQFKAEEERKWQDVNDIMNKRETLLHYIRALNVVLDMPNAWSYFKEIKTVKLDDKASIGLP